MSALTRVNQYTYFVQKERRWILGGLTVGAALFTLYLFTNYVPMYTSQLKLYIRNLPAVGVAPTRAEETAVRSESGYSNPLFNYQEILESSKLAKNLYVRLKDTYPDEFKRLGVKSVTKWERQYKNLIKSKVEPSTDVIKVTFGWVDPKSQQAVMTALVEEYQNTVLEIRRESNTARREYLDQQLKSITDRLVEVRHEIEKFSSKNIVFNLPVEGEELTRAKVDLEKQAEQARSSMDASQAKMADLSQQLGVSNARQALVQTGIGQDTSLIAMTDRLEAQKQEYSKKMATLTEEHPDAIEVKNQISSLTREIEKRKAEHSGPIKVTRGLYDKASSDVTTDLAKTQSEYKSYKTLASSLERSSRNLTRKIVVLPAKRAGLDSLLQEEKTLSGAYEGIMQKQIEAQIKENEIINNIVSLGSPTESKFSSTELVLKILGFLLFGTFLGTAIAWVKNDLEDQWTGSGEIEAVTGSKVLGIIPWVDTKKLGADNIGKMLGSPHSIHGIAYANIASSLIARSYLNQAQVLTFLSTLPSRKTSTILYNMTSLMAKMGKPVMIIDADFYQPNKAFLEFEKVAPKTHYDLVSLIQEINRQIRQQGIDLARLNVPALIEQAVLQIPVKDDTVFHYLAASQAQDVVYDYVASKGFQLIVEEVKKHFEFVFIDIPNRSYVFPEINTLMAHSDSVVILSGLDTARKELTEMISTLKQNEISVLGVISREKDLDLSRYQV
jgi:uncharacterized protein involved in exopolysaccharide biosynthesis/Mrp family chromosome partitioning ATPase